MPIVFPWPFSVERYLKAFPGNVPIPDRCPFCQWEGRLHRHGARRRRPPLEVPIQRVRCPRCGKTFSLLPSFLLPYRHYVVSVIQRALLRRFAAGWSLGRLETGFEDEVPRNTLLAWLTAFRAHALVLIQEALAFLARWRPEWEVWRVGPEGPARLLALAPALRAVLEEALGQSLGGMGPLALLSLWASGRGLGRVV